MSYGQAKAAPLVGRSDELGRILAKLKRTAGGHGGTLLLAGEPGVGKSRLAGEALALARQRGFLTLQGSAYPLHEGLAYAPVLEALEPFLAGLQPSRRAELVWGLPDLGRLFSGLRLPPPEPLGDAALERTRLFEAVSRLVERIAARSPLVLFVDDLHWADPASFELLHYVARGLADQRVLLLGAYRLDEARTHPRLRTLMRSLQRLELAEELVLNGLTPDAVVALTRGLLDGDPPGELLDILHVRAAGIPLFVVALVRGLLETRGLVRSGGAWVLGGAGLAAVPTIVRDVVLSRLERLDATAQRVLEAVVVAGDAASLALLRRVAVVAEEELLVALRWLVEAGLLTEKRSGPDLVYHATHPLIAEVAYGELPQTLRCRLHAAVAAALEALKPGDLERLAHHYRGAGAEVDPARALDVLVAAAERALQLHADDEAAGHLAAAVELARIGRGDLVGELLERLGHAESAAGHLDAAVAAWQEAVGERERAGDRPAAARLYVLLAEAEWDRAEAAEAYLEKGFQMVAGIEETGELIDLHTARVRILTRVGDVDGVEREAVALLALAERTGAQHAVAAVHLARASLASLNNRHADILAHAAEALAVAEAARQPLLAAPAHRHLYVAALALGDHRLARQHAYAELALAERAGVPTLQAGPRAGLLAAEMISAAWDDALLGIDHVVALCHRVGPPRGVAWALAIRGMILAHRGQLGGAAACLAEARAVFGDCSADRRVFTLLDVAEATIALVRGDAARARALTAQCMVLPATLLPCLGLAVLGQAELALGDPAHTLDIARRLAVLGPGGSWPAACAAWMEGLARGALGEPVPALACLERAAGGFDDLEMPFEAARARLGWAEAAAASGAPSRPRRPPAKAWRPSIGSAPGRTPTGPAGCSARWVSGRPPLLAGLRPPSCRSGSYRWPAWSPRATRTPRSPSGCSSARAP